MDGAGCGAPFSRRVTTGDRQLLDERRRQYFGETSSSRLQDAVFQRRPEIQTVARARQRDVQKALGLFPFLVTVIVVGVGAEIADSDRYIVAARVRRHANRVAIAAGSSRQV